MRKTLKLQLPIAALTVAILTLIAVAVHYDDEPLKHFTRSFEKQKTFSSCPTLNIKTPLSMPFLGPLGMRFHVSISSCRGTLSAYFPNPLLIFFLPLFPYRGPPTAIPS
ncbi:hypothetical protein SAMN04489760_12917 [Syntrophus gentianae]|uniref:Uncharacterized protein n=1 Tax=Syntrophus gentianae TaxID=43775 RepID=A0A1H8A0S8_9BACT|nr:hypothetical protein [Syntrophus gentianae]SEM64133.1 hypothetical protein SAMN04489760_12917 [Syntrophus gentianae]